MDHLDYDAVNTLKDVMGDDFTLLIDTFIQDSQERIEKLQSGSDSDAIRRSAHSFKGSCSNIGALVLTRLCADLEAKALAGNLHQLDTDMEQIQLEFTQVRSLLLAFLN